MNHWVSVLGLAAIAVVPSFAFTDEGLRTIRGSVHVQRIPCYIAPCPILGVTLLVPNREEQVRLTGEVAKELVALERKNVEVVGSFDAANPDLLDVKKFRVLPER